MSIQPIRLFPDCSLSTSCEDVRRFDPAIASIVRDLLDTMKASPGVGLAAPQIGVCQRIAVIDVNRVLKQRTIESSYHGLLVLLNPQLVEGRGRQVPREGCLSVPDLLANVVRYAEVDVLYEGSSGERKSLTAIGFEALAVQHEIDHLNGKLFLDRVANLKTDVFRRKR